ncbi:MAG: hypothetical protein AB8H03_23220 [Saprospiraceae bacterium]
MKKQINVPHLRQLIAQNKTQQVFDQLNAAAITMSDSTLRNKITLLEARWKKLKEEQIKGIISSENQGLENNRINNNLLTLLEEVENPPATPLVNEPSQKTSWKTILTIFAATIGVLAGIAEISGYSIRDWWESNPPTNNTPAQIPIDTTATSTGTSTPTNPQTPTTNQPKNKTTTETPPPKEKLQVQIKTNKGSKDLIFNESEEVRLFFKVNRPCKLRTIYRLADGMLILLDNDRLVNTPETNKWVELSDGFEVAAPFGVEELYIFAQEKDFPSLQTIEQDGYTIIQEGLPTALSKTRGLKKKPVFAESKLNITTQKK